MVLLLWMCFVLGWVLPGAGAGPGLVGLGGGQLSESLVFLAWAEQPQLCSRQVRVVQVGVYCM